MEFKVGDERSTRQRVVRSILAAGSATAADLASELDVTPAAIRRHLDALVEEGLIASRDARHSARGRGRPAKEFVITELGRGRFDQQYDELAMHALRFLAQTGGDDAVKALLNSVSPSSSVTTRLWLQPILISAPLRCWPRCSLMRATKQGFAICPWLPAVSNCVNSTAR
ncbi:MAG: helix-turn-helix domain-containing protein [Marmoricola sp.]